MAGVFKMLLGGAKNLAARGAQYLTSTGIVGTYAARAKISVEGFWRRNVSRRLRQLQRVFSDVKVTRETATSSNRAKIKIHGLQVIDLKALDKLTTNEIIVDDAAIRQQLENERTAASSALGRDAIDADQLATDAASATAAATIDQVEARMELEADENFNKYYEKHIIHPERYQIEFEVAKDFSLGELDFTKFKELVATNTITNLTITDLSTGQILNDDAAKDAIYSTLDLFKKFSVDERLQPSQAVDVLQETSHLPLFGPLVNLYLNILTSRVVSQNFSLLPNLDPSLETDALASGAESSAEQIERIEQIEQIERYQLDLAKLAAQKNNSKLLEQYYRSIEFQQRLDLLNLTHYHQRIAKIVEAREKELKDYRKQFLKWFIIVAIVIAVLALLKPLVSLFNYLVQNVSFIGKIVSAISNAASAVWEFFQSSSNPFLQLIINGLVKGSGFVAQFIRTFGATIISNPYYLSAFGGVLVLYKNVNTEYKREYLKYYKELESASKTRIKELKEAHDEVKLEIAKIADNEAFINAEKHRSTLDFSKRHISPAQLKSCLARLTEDNAPSAIIAPHRNFSAINFLSTLEILTGNNLKNASATIEDPNIHIYSITLDASHHSWFVNTLNSKWWAKAYDVLKNNYYLQEIQYNGYAFDDVLLVQDPSHTLTETQAYDWLKSLESKPAEIKTPIYNFYRELNLNRLLAGRAIDQDLQILLFNNEDQAIKMAKEKIRRNFFIKTPLALDNAPSVNRVLQLETNSVIERNQKLYRLQELAASNNFNLDAISQAKDLLLDAVKKLNKGELQEYLNHLKLCHTEAEISHFLTYLKKIFFTHQGLVKLLASDEAKENCLELAQLLEPSMQFKTIDEVKTYFCQQLIENNAFKLEHLKDWPYELKTQILNTLLKEANLKRYLGQNNQNGALATSLQQLDAASRQQMLVAILKLSSIKSRDELLNPLAKILDYLLSKQSLNETQQHQLESIVQDLFKITSDSKVPIKLENLDLLVLYNRLVDFSKQLDDKTLISALAPYKNNEEPSPYHFYPLVATNDWEEELNQRLLALYLAKNQGSSESSQVNIKRLYSDQTLVKTALEQLRLPPVNGILPWMASHKPNEISLLADLMNSPNLEHGLIWSDILKGVLLEPKDRLISLLQKKAESNDLEFLNKYLSTNTKQNSATKTTEIPTIPLNHPVIAVALALEARTLEQPASLTFNALRPQIAYIIGAKLWLNTDSEALKQAICQNLEPAFHSLKDLLNFAVTNHLHSKKSLIQVISNITSEFPDLDISNEILDEIVTALYPSIDSLTRETLDYELITIKSPVLQEAWLAKVMDHYFDKESPDAERTKTALTKIINHVLNQYAGSDYVKMMLLNMLKAKKTERRQGLFRTKVITYSVLNPFKELVLFNELTTLTKQNPDDMVLKTLLSDFHPTVKTDSWQQELKQQLAALYLAQHPEIELDNIFIDEVANENLYQDEALLTKALANSSLPINNALMPWATQHGADALVHLIAVKASNALFDSLLEDALVAKDTFKAKFTGDNIASFEIRRLIAEHLIASPLTNILNCFTLNLKLAKCQEARLVITNLDKLSLEEELAYQIGAAIIVNSEDDLTKKAMQSLFNGRRVPSIAALFRVATSHQIPAEKLAIAIVEAIASSHKTLNPEMLTALKNLLGENGAEKMQEALPSIAFENIENQTMLEDFLEEKIEINRALGIEPLAIQELRAQELDKERPLASFKQLTLSQVNKVIRLSGINYKTIQNWARSMGQDKLTKIFSQLNYAPRVTLLARFYAPMLPTRGRLREARQLATLVSWLMNQNNPKLNSFISRLWLNPLNLTNTKKELIAMLSSSNSKADQQLLREVRHKIEQLETGAGLGSSEDLDHQNDTGLVDHYLNLNNKQLDSAFSSEIQRRLHDRRASRDTNKAGSNK